MHTFQITAKKNKYKDSCILRFGGFSTIFSTFQIDFHNGNTTCNLNSPRKFFFLNFFLQKNNLITSSYFRSESSAISCASANCCSSVAIRSSSWYVRCSRPLRPLKIKRKLFFNLIKKKSFFLFFTVHFHQLHVKLHQVFVLFV